MQALQFSEAGSLESLQLNELPKPVPGAGEVLIEVRAAGLNPSDLKNVLGRFPYTTAPRIPGRDFSGVVVEELQAQGVRAFQLRDAEELPEQTQAHFAQQSPEVIFDTTGFWLPAAVNTVGTLGRIAVIAAPVDGMISMPILNLYRRGGSVIGVNSLLYSLEDCARMLEQINAAFDGALPVPENFSEWSLSDAVAAYHKVNEGGAEKIVLIP
ncbi:quinone oxidoreductase family protein [Marinobacter piscensis]|uniref:quinone oxidoreductase family protein n=1 Tax=Marinobacter piscensis TaxID=1562308 RepID=UPI0011A79F52|nr:zinc-binding alcohol dehydrogenase family protein [Marinobacter piscensis]